MNRLTPALLCLLLGACDCGGGAVRVVVRFEGFEPGCLEVSADDVAGGAPDSVQLEAAQLKNGKAVIGIAQKAEWSRSLSLKVRSFERGCEGPVLEEFSQALTVEPRVLGSWEVTLTAIDADQDGYAAASPGVSGTDCDDASAARHPGATEACGAIDANCDGRAGCADPLCVGSTCDDGVPGNTRDVCLSGGGCAGSAFTDCMPGTWVTDAGTATVDRQCTACLTGSYSATTNAASCASWSDCVPGQRVSVPPSSSADRTCVACDAGTWSSMANSSDCSAVGTCAPGTVQTAPAPLQCAACVPGTYCAGGLSLSVPCASGTWDNDSNPASVCAPWTSCAPGFASSAPGTATTDATCSACAAGTYCAGMLAPAVACASGTWDHDANSATTCVAWTSCAAGSSVNMPGSATGDRTCLPCAAGTFSTTPDAASCQTWASCVAGQFVSSAGTASTDRFCSACLTGFTTMANATACSAWTACSSDTYQVAAPTTTSDRVCANYTSCLDRFTRVSTTPSGSYLIDPDGAGAGAPITVTCDMTTAPGGWTVISFEDFSTSAAGWSDSRRDTTTSCFDDWGAMLGGYTLFGNNASSSKTYPLLGVTHTQVRVALDYFVIDSWDNESARVSVDGTFIYNAAFSQGGNDTCGALWDDRGRQTVVGTQAHTVNQMTLIVTSTLSQGANDESFGVDNVSVMIR